MLAKKLSAVLMKAMVSATAHHRRLGSAYSGHRESSSLLSSSWLTRSGAVWLVLSIDELPHCQAQARGQVYTRGTERSGVLQSFIRFTVLQCASPRDLRVDVFVSTAEALLRN